MVTCFLLDVNKAFEYRNFCRPICLSRYDQSGVGKSTKFGVWNGEYAGIVILSVVFSGENVSNEIRDRVNAMIKPDDQILVFGTPGAVLSAQRLVRAAKLEGKGIALMTSGTYETRKHLWRLISGSGRDHPRR